MDGLRYSEPLETDRIAPNLNADSEGSYDASESPLLLTFGIEFECILLYKPDWYEQNLAKLPQDGLPCRPDSSFKLLAGKKKSRTPSVWVREKDDRTRHALHEINEYYEALVEKHLCQSLREVFVPVAEGHNANGENCWVVARDPSLFTTESGESLRREGWEYLHLEIKTPILGYDPRALAQVTGVLKALIKNFNDGVSWKLYANKSCGMHVHVGTQKLSLENCLTNEGHSWPAIRNLYTVGTLFEKQINTVFPTDRVSGMSIYARPNSHTFRKFGDVQGALAIIRDSSNFRDLVNKTDMQREVAYLPHPLYDTIEFRQHHGTVDAEAACSWVQFACGLIRAVHAAGDAGFPPNFLDRSKEEGFDFLALLSALNMDSLKEYYGKSGVLTEQRDILPWETASGVFNPDWTDPDWMGSDWMDLSLLPPSETLDEDSDSDGAPKRQKCTIC